MNIRHNIGALAFASFAAFLTGCSSFSQPKDQSKKHSPIDGGLIASSVVLCKTTLTDLRKQLGAPTRDGLLRKERVMSWITASEPVTRYLAVLADAQGVVVDLYWDLPTEIPWIPKDQCHSK